MTLILAVGNDRNMVQFSDRRLSSNRVIVDDHANKATVFICSNGRFVVGYTGLARVGPFLMQDWIVDALIRCASPEFGIYETTLRLKDDLKRLFLTNEHIARLPATARRLTIMFSGFVYNVPRGRAGSLLLSNFQNFTSGHDQQEAGENFELWPFKEKEKLDQPFTYVQRVGAWPAMSVKDEKILRDLAANNAPVETIIDAGVGIIRDIASRPAARGAVGKEIQITVIPRDLNIEIRTHVRHEKSQATIVFHDQVVAFPDHQFAVKAPQISINDAESGFPPKIGRNERCYCGSGIKYKKCHGK